MTRFLERSARYNHETGLWHVVEVETTTERRKRWSRLGWHNSADAADALGRQDIEWESVS